MSTRRTDPKTFFASPEAVALLVNPDEFFGLLTRSYELPRDQGALLTGDEGDRLTGPPGSTISAEGLRELMLVRTTPFVLEFDGHSASSLDGYSCSASVKVRFSLVLDPSELAAFQRELLGSGRAVRLSDVHAHFEAPLARALALVAEGRGVDVLIDPKNADTLAAELADRLKQTAFAAGLAIESPIVVTFDSPMYRQVRHARAEAQRHREEFAARHRIEQARETAQAKHAEKLASLLDDLRTMADASPDHRLPDLIRTFPDRERGELYGALIEADEHGATTDAIVVGSGAELLFFAPISLDAPHRRLAVPGDVGPVRSVQTCVDGDAGRRLLVGASIGIYELPADGSGDIVTYDAGPCPDVKGGVNSVALAGEFLFASHSELGLLCWRRGETETARRLLQDRTRSQKAVRCAQFFNGHLYVSIDHDVYRLRGDAPDRPPVILRGSRALITAVCPTVSGVYAGNAEGEILYWPDDRVDQPDLVHAGRRRSAESVVLLDAGDLPRLFFTDTSIAVHARVLDDTFTCRYEAGGQTLRRVEVAPDVVVAINEVRDRLFCWTPGRPAEPYAVASVARLTGHSIQDVCLVPAV